MVHPDGQPVTRAFQISPAIDMEACLVGRETEIAFLERLVRRRDRTPGMALLVGEPGAGKTVLLRHAAVTAAADGAVVVPVHGLVVEADLRLGAIHRLLAPPAFRLRETLGGRRYDIVMRHLTHPFGDRHARIEVAAATLELLERLAADTPVLVAADDLHLLDADSRFVLSYVAGRVDPNVVVVLGAGIDATMADELPARDVHVVAALDEAAALSLVTRQLGYPPPPAVLAELVTATGGNPRAIIESCRMLSDAHLAGEAQLPDPLPLGLATSRAFAAAVRGLPERTRQVLLFAAVDPDLTAADLGRAARKAGTGLETLLMAEDAGLITVTEAGVRFAHPLTRAAVYGAALPSARRAAREIVAAVCPRRALRHLAAIAVEPDGVLAARLSDEVDQVRLSAGHPTAAELGSRAADLTPPGAGQAHRYLIAARDTWLGGNPSRALAVLGRVATSYGGLAAVTAEVDLLRAEIAMRQDSVSDAYEALMAIANRTDGIAFSTRARALTKAALAAWYVGDLHRFRTVGEHVALLDPTEIAGLPVADRLGLDYVVGLSAEFFWRFEEATTPVRRTAEYAAVVNDPEALVLAAGCMIARGDDVQVHALATRALDAARSASAHTAVPHAIEVLSHANCWSGRFPLTVPYAREGLALARDTGQPTTQAHMLANLAMASAIAGNIDDCRDHAARAQALARPRAVGLTVALATWALGMAEVVYGRWEAAYRQLERLYSTAPGVGHPIMALYATPYFVEAAVGAGASAVARERLNHFQRWAIAIGRPGQLALSARCEALLAGGPAVAEHFQRAVALHQRSDRDFEHGYTELLYARHLRRNRHRIEARERLHNALEMFERLELTLWTSRVQAELRATGERVTTTPPDADPATGAGLTSQQIRIVRHVVGGATNREISELMFVSPRTVDYHLRNIFTRLGIRSRAELIRRFRDAPPGSPPGGAS